MRLFPTLLLVLSLFAASRLAADPAAEITSFSTFKEVDMKKLAKGEVIAASGASMKFARGLEVETMFLLPMPVAKANEAQQKWDGSRHSELKIYQHVDLPRRPSVQDFQRLASAPHNRSVDKFAAATEKLNPERPELQMSAVEAKGAGSAGKTEAGGKGISASVAAFWSGLLHSRASAFASGGLGAQPAYLTRGGAIRPADEAAALLRERGAIHKQFSSLASAMTGGGGALSYELFDVEGRAAASLGATFSRAAGDSIQSGTVQFYSSDGYLVMLTFIQMWPVQVDGKTATLVWRSDMLSSSQLGDLRGIERSGSSVAMRKEIQKNVASMVKDISSQR